MSALDKAAWVVGYLADHSRGGRCPDTGMCAVSWLGGNTAWDDELDFVTAFGEAFPGRRPDLELTSRRLRATLLVMWRAGILQRFRQGNHDRATAEEPRWQHVYALWSEDLTALRDQRTSTAELVGRGLPDG